MSRDKWLVLALVFVLQFLLASVPILGIILQPLVIVIWLFSIHMSTRQIVVIAGLAGVLSELLSSGSRGEVFAVYLSFGLIISVVKELQPQYLGIPGMAPLVFLVFSGLFGMAGLLGVSVIAPTMIGVLILEIVGLFIISILSIWLLRKMFNGQKYG